MDSILDSVKKLLGIDSSYTAFDTDIIIHINSVFMILEQMGIGSSFSISDNTSKWSDYFSSDSANSEAVKSYMYMKVRMMFDPPQSSIVADAMKTNIAELEWRLYVTAENDLAQTSS